MNVSKKVKQNHIILTISITTTQVCLVQFNFGHGLGKFQKGVNEKNQPKSLAILYRMCRLHSFKL